jgi:hypothetical protein
MEGETDGYEWVIARHAIGKTGRPAQVQILPFQTPVQVSPSLKTSSTNTNGIEGAAVSCHGPRFGNGSTKPGGSSTAFWGIRTRP